MMDEELVRKIKEQLPNENVYSIFERDDGMYAVYTVTKEYGVVYAPNKLFTKDGDMVHQKVIKNSKGEEHKERLVFEDENVKRLVEMHKKMQEELLSILNRVPEDERGPMWRSLYKDTLP